MNILWRLLRQHVSMAQLSGFFLAGLTGTVIILFGLQFYLDVSPLLRGQDGLFKREYLILSKPVSTLGSLLGSKGTFGEKEIKALGAQPFVHQVGRFTSSAYRVSASLGMEGTSIHVGTDMFFESVPDEYLDVASEHWHYEEGSRVIPIILPRNYLNLYNFGFAQSRNLPKLSEGLLSMVHLSIRLSGNGRADRYEGRIVGFSNRLNTILVPEAFMKWSNAYYASADKIEPSRLIVEVKNPADERIVKYLQAHSYETEGDDLEAGKAVWFLQMLVGIVLLIGVVITFLSFYVLVLSIFLLLQKNTKKMQALLLLGYSPGKIALPYQLMVVVLNLGVTVLALVGVWCLRGICLSRLRDLFPMLEEGEALPVWLAGAGLFLFVSGINIWIIHRKLKQVWNGK